MEWAEDDVSPGRQVFGFWHEDSFCMNLVLEQLAGRTRPVHVIVTADTRGDYIERMVESCGGHALRVADGRASFGKLKEILEEFRGRDASLAVALDGPLGPRHEPKRLAFYFAELLGVEPPSLEAVGQICHPSALLKGDCAGPQLRQCHQEEHTCPPRGDAEGKTRPFCPEKDVVYLEEKDKRERQQEEIMEDNHILIVEDDKEIREGVEIYLKSQGYKVFQARDGVEGLEILDREEIHLAIVDIMMPRMDGIQMTLKLREKYDFPVIMLSAKSEEVDKITGLGLGADDYVTKPFAPMELMARVNSQLRRYRKFLEKLEVKGNVHVIGGLEINEDTVEVSVDGSPVKLTPLEYKILLLLAKNPGRVFSADEIYERVWQERAINTDTVMVHVRNIREKIELDPKNPKYLKVVWGVGYKIEKQD